MTRRTLRLKRLLFLQLGAALICLAVALVTREVLLAVTRAAFKMKQVPQVWLGPRGSANYGRSGALYAGWAGLVTILLGYLAYGLYVRFFEERPVDELERHKAATELAAGTGIGLGMVAAIVASLWLLDDFRIQSINDWWWGAGALATAATAAFMEELIFRGIIFRLIEKRLGSWLALVLSALFFGYAHSRNAGATLSSVISVAVSGGIVLGLAFIATRRLWLPIGIHFGVNAGQGALLGMAVSGQETPGFLTSVTQGSPLLTGGRFGLEASILVGAASIVVAGALVRFAIVKKRFRTL